LGEKRGQFAERDFLPHDFAFHPNGRTLILTGPSILLWDSAENRVTKRIPLDTGRAESLAVSPDGLQVAAKRLDFGGRTSTFGTWELSLGRRLHRLAPSGAGSWQVGRAAFSPDGRTLAITLPDGTLQFRDAASFALLKRILVGEVYQIAFSPDGNLLATCGWGNAVARLWNPRTGELVRAILPPSQSLNLDGGGSPTTR
jgi:WD40 repeat protein